MQGGTGRRRDHKQNPGENQKMKVISRPPGMQPLRNRHARWFGGRGHGWLREASTKTRPGR